MLYKLRAAITHGPEELAGLVMHLVPVVHRRASGSTRPIPRLAQRRRTRAEIPGTAARGTGCVRRPRPSRATGCGWRHRSGRVSWSACPPAQTELERARGQCRGQQPQWADKKGGYDMSTNECRPRSARPRAIRPHGTRPHRGRHHRSLGSRLSRHCAQAAAAARRGDPCGDEPGGASHSRP